ncbi:uncharacterized protein THITE_2118175 [Thermothielavioides terrestris NRRL 8126]|uniref:Peptidase M14 domain-containing protein n=1 Tax=Thermothielavioides terrestris (strain ATCC 38088 / NRRL 8126) TaxID=578455 RepID=G2R913_THETT|nr:uncharacterized protein THITE_2118175 [Thermothielavioides terrestris NRRL 8126]AEO68608.1 hypothetical protein THITE_2118175 [Thermothielavioides terrestris NRRL 8126]
MKLLMKLLPILVFLFIPVSLSAAPSPLDGLTGNESLESLSWFERYHDYRAHVDYLRRLSEEHRSRARIFTAGKSFKKRNIWGIHLFGKSGPRKKPAVVFFGTAHAREWITTMVTEYIASRLLTSYGVSKDVRYALDSFDFYIFPVVNPDGFVHSQTTHRMWRKNRQRQDGTSCVGRDLNRNWDVHWDDGAGGGASAWPCHPTYRGHRAFDAPETMALATALQAIKQRQGLRLFIDWHSFGQLVMHPYGYSCDKKLPRFSAAAWLAGELAEAMSKVHGAEYKAGAACELLYATTGDSVDYAFEVLGADYAYTIELRPGPRARGGFRLPEDQILATAEEAWAGVRHALQFIHRY